MKHPSFFVLAASSLAACLSGLVGLSASPLAACSSPLTATPDDAGLDASTDARPLTDTFVPPTTTDAAIVNCTVNGGEDFVDLCLQKQILAFEHTVFDPKIGIASSWNANTGKPDGASHDFRDDVAYAASLSLYETSSQVYGDTEIRSRVVTPDLTALAPLVEAELATLPGSYDGELYMRLRRFAGGMRNLNDTTNGDKIDAIADAYGRAIFVTYFHALAPVDADAGADGGPGDAGDDAASDAGADAGADAAVPSGPIGDGILGVAATGGGFAYDVDQAASGALALVDLASRHEKDDAASAHTWARAAGSVLNHLYARARHSSGLYYADLVTSADPDHDALASVVTPTDALLAETQASVAASLMRASAIVKGTGMLELTSFPFAHEVVSPLSGLKGVAPDGGIGLSLWDPTPTPATTAACGLLADAASCGGSGFFVRYLPSTGLDNSSKTIRANALALSAVHRSLALPGTAASIDYEPLLALFEAQVVGHDQSFISQVFQQASYPSAVGADLSLLTPPGSFTAQADAYAIEALTEQWVGRQDCPLDFL